MSDTQRYENLFFRDSNAVEDAWDDSYSFNSQWSWQRQCSDFILDDQMYRQPVQYSASVSRQVFDNHI